MPGPDVHRLVALVADDATDPELTRTTLARARPPPALPAEAAESVRRLAGS